MIFCTEIWQQNSFLALRKALKEEAEALLFPQAFGMLSYN